MPRPDLGSVGVFSYSVSYSVVDHRDACGLGRADRRVARRDLAELDRELLVRLDLVVVKDPDRDVARRLTRCEGERARRRLIVRRLPTPLTTLSHFCHTWLRPPHPLHA